MKRYRLITRGWRCVEITRVQMRPLPQGWVYAILLDIPEMNLPLRAQARHGAVQRSGEKAGTPATSETRGIVTVASNVPDYELLRRIGHGAYGKHRGHLLSFGQFE